MGGTASNPFILNSVEGWGISRVAIPFILNSVEG